MVAEISFSILVWWFHMNFHTRKIRKSFVTIVTCKWICSCSCEFFFCPSFLVLVHFNFLLFRFSFFFFVVICHDMDIDCTFCIKCFIAIFTENIFDIGNNFTLFQFRNSNSWSMDTCKRLRDYFWTDSFCFAFRSALSDMAFCSSIRFWFRIASRFAFNLFMKSS